MYLNFSNFSNTKKDFSLQKINNSISTKIKSKPLINFHEITEDDSGGTSVASSSEAMSFTGGKFPIQKDKIDFKERFKNLKIRRKF